MCKIRTIILNNEKEIKNDFVVEVNNIDINIIDRPAFCIFCPHNANGYASILFKYSNIDENIIQKFSEDSLVSIGVGQQSGCVYSFLFREEASSIHLDELVNELLTRNNTIRYQNNIRNFLKLIGEIRKSVNNRSKRSIAAK